jgi:hypothetical protein
MTVTQAAPAVAAGCWAARSCRRCGAETPRAPARQSTVLCFHRDRRVGAGCADRRHRAGVLNCQQLPPFHQPSGAGMGDCHHLARRHAWIMQEPPDLARSVAAKREDPNSVLADRKKTVQKERPPFPSDGRQTAPACVPFRFLRHSLTARESEAAPRRKANTAIKSVHVVGSRPGIMGLSAARDFGLSPSRASQSNGTI